MIANIIELSIKNKFLVILATLFVIAAGLYAMQRIPLDAIPDLSDVQVIILTEYPGQAPQVVEDQVTYPLTTAMLSVPFAKVVRGFSFFGLSFVYVIFEDGTDMYWARSRVLEYLNFVSGRLPAGHHADPGPGCHRGGMGLRLHPGKRAPRPLPAALHPGLVSALRAGQPARGGRSGLHRRVRQAVSGHCRPQQASGLQHAGPESAHGHPAEQQRCGRTRGGNGGNRVHGARAGLHRQHP